MTCDWQTVFFLGKDVTAELVKLSMAADNRRTKRAVTSPWEGLSGIDTSYDPQVITVKIGTGSNQVANIWNVL